MAEVNPQIEDLESKVPEFADEAVRAPYSKRINAGKTVLVVSNGQLIRRKLGEQDVVIKAVAPRRRVRIIKKPAA